MAPILAGNSQRQVPVDIVGPINQAGTNSTAVVAGSEIDGTTWDTISYTIIVTTFGLTWSVFGANVSDYSDEVAVLAPAAVAAGNNSSYISIGLPYRFYRVKIVNTVGGQNGNANVNGIAKEL